MSPVFRHGRLRLYLLKLLDEAPRHGYEVIRLLQDRFLGVYAPSPGTIYPRLARLEEDGLVTHEEVNGRKVYRITDKGREEIRSRLGDLADLEDELTESIRDVAREISEDVRDTVRGIREDLTSAARDFRKQDAKNSSGAAEQGGEQGAGQRDGEAGGASDEARRIREEAKRTRDEIREKFMAQGRNRRDSASWQERAGRPDSAAWAAWSDWDGQAGGTTTGGVAGDRTSNATTTGDVPGDDPSSGTAGDASQRSRPGGTGQFGDLERLAMQFASELSAAARHTGDIGPRSLSDLRDILTDTLAKVRDEVFSVPSDQKPAAAGQPPDAGDHTTASDAS